MLGFGSSAKLAAAYGIAVTGTLAIDTILFFVVVRMLWRKPLWLALSGAAAFLFVDLAFFAANLPKVAHGGWFPLLLALRRVHDADDVAARARARHAPRRERAEGPLRDFVEEIRAWSRRCSAAPGTGGLPDRGQATRRRWRCARTSTTTTSCTRAS